MTRHADMGNPDLALPLAEEALHVNRFTVGDMSEETLDSVGMVADVHRIKKDFEAALPLALEALAGRRIVLGNEHAHTLLSITQLALIYEGLGNMKSAMPLCEEDVKTSRKKAEL